MEREEAGRPVIHHYLVIDLPEVGARFQAFGDLLGAHRHLPFRRLWGADWHGQVGWEHIVGFRLEEFWAAQEIEAAGGVVRRYLILSLDLAAALQREGRLRPAAALSVLAVPGLPTELLPLRDDCPSLVGIPPHEGVEGVVGRLAKAGYDINDEFLPSERRSEVVHPADAPTLSASSRKTLSAFERYAAPLCRAGRPPRARFVVAGPEGVHREQVADAVVALCAELGVLPLRTAPVEVAGPFSTGDPAGVAAEVEQRIRSAQGGALVLRDMDSWFRTNYSLTPIAETIADALRKALREPEQPRCIVVSGLPEQLEALLSLHSSVSSAFACRLDLDAVTAEQASARFCEVLRADGYCVDATVERAFASLVSRLAPDLATSNFDLVDSIALATTLAACTRNVAETADAPVVLATDVTAPGQFRRDDAPPESAEEVLSRFDALVGLRNIKDKIADTTSIQAVQAMRRATGINGSPLNLHMAFLGNPGTGKTTVARLLGHLYRSHGLLPSGHLVVAGRENIVADWIGQTSNNMRRLIERSLGGVLFIDEVYSLTRSDSPRDFGYEALDVLVHLMERHVGDFALVVAGYPNKMENFFRANEGLRSRFVEVVTFPDYSPDDLGRIFAAMATESAYEVENDAVALVVAYMETVTRGPAFGNARLARNLFDSARIEHARRVVEEETRDADSLTLLKASDVARTIRRIQ